MVNAPDVVRPTSGESTTRARVLADVSEFGPITISGLVARLELTETALRRHVDALAAEGLIEAHEAASRPRGRGRPAKAWVVSAHGHSELRAGYDDLARETLRFLAEYGGRDAVGEFARRRARAMVQRWAGENSEAAVEVGARADALVEALNDQGYAATARPMDQAGLTGIQICQGHCPIQDVAAEFPELCDAEAEVFSEVLGVHVQRLATLTHGGHVCTTFVPTPIVPPSTTTERSTT